MVECVLTWIREQYLVVTLKNEPFCVLLKPVIKLFRKGVKVHQKRVILMQKMKKKFLQRGTPPPHTPPSRRLRRLDLNPPHSEILPTLLRAAQPVINVKNCSLYTS